MKGKTLMIIAAMVIIYAVLFIAAFPKQTNFSETYQVKNFGEQQDKGVYLGVSVQDIFKELRLEAKGYDTKSLQLPLYQKDACLRPEVKIVRVLRTSVIRIDYFFLVSGSRRIYSLHDFITTPRMFYSLATIDISYDTIKAKFEPDYAGFSLAFLFVAFILIAVITYNFTATKKEEAMRGSLGLEKDAK